MFYYQNDIFNASMLLLRKVTMSGINVSVVFLVFQYFMKARDFSFYYLFRLIGEAT